MNSVATLMSPDSSDPSPAATPTPVPDPVSPRAKRFLYSVQSMGDHPMVALGQVLHADGLVKPDQQAAAMGLKKSTVVTMLKAMTKPKAATMKQIAIYLDFPQDDLAKLFPNALATEPSEDEVEYALSVLHRMAKRKKAE